MKKSGTKWTGPSPGYCNRTEQVSGHVPDVPDDLVDPFYLHGYVNFLGTMLFACTASRTVVWLVLGRNGIIEM